MIKTRMSMVENTSHPGGAVPTQSSICRDRRGSKAARASAICRSTLGLRGGLAQPRLTACTSMVFSPQRIVIGGFLRVFVVVVCARRLVVEGGPHDSTRRPIKQRIATKITTAFLGRKAAHPSGKLCFATSRRYCATKGNR